MNLNNNWSQNVDTGKWTPRADVLKKSDFDALAQDLKSYRFYQKCLSGSTYVGVHSLIEGTTSNSNLYDVYDILTTGSTQSTYYFDYISPGGLTYSENFINSIPDRGSDISTLESLRTWSQKVNSDYNLTLKNLFTPERLINDQKENLFYVDLATTERYNTLTGKLAGLVIDGVRVREGHRILVKNQYTDVTILSSIDPDKWFYGYYEVVEVVGLNTTYRIPNADNGIYIYINNSLVRTDDLNSYDKLLRYSICVKLGTTNREKQFKLRRLRSGFFPEYYTGSAYPSDTNVGESMYFEETHNFVLRQRVDYNNLYELSLQDTIKHATQSLVVSLISGSISSTYSYTIPERTITVGEFGSLINHQEGITNIIDSKYKVNLRSITQTSRYYWICGDEGILLKVDKIDFSIQQVELRFPNTGNQPSNRILTSLNSIQFFNDLRGVVVGKFNQIWITNDAGFTWKQIYLGDFDGYNYNKVIFTSIDKFYVGGDNGVFIEFEYNLENWYAYKRRISKYVNGLDDEYILVDDITDLVYFERNNNPYILIGCELNTIYLYDIRKSLSNSWDFLYLQDNIKDVNDFGDVTGLTYLTQSQDKVYFSTFDHIYQIDPISGSFSVGTKSNIFSITFSQFFTQSAINSINSYQEELIYTGNFSLWKINYLSTTQSFDVWDSDFFARLKPRLLFMDYDIGSKLYWFDDFHQYRIPERYEIPVSFLQGPGNNTYLSFDRATNSYFDGTNYVDYLEENWISYFKDRQKTFQYYASDSLKDSFKVEPSFTFSSSDACGMTFGYATKSVATQYLKCVDLMPIAVPPMQEAGYTQSSRFRDLINIPIIPPSSSYNLYFYDYLGIWSETFTGGVLPEVGDVLHISSDVFEGRFIINKTIFTQSSPINGEPAESTGNFLANKNKVFTGLYATISISVDGIPISGTISFQGGNPDGIIDGTNLPGAESIPTSPTFNFLIAFYNFVANQINNSGTGFTAFVDVNNYCIRINSPVGSFYNGFYPQLFCISTDPGGFGQPFMRANFSDFSGGVDPYSLTTGYFYFYTDFNQNIINNIPNSKSLYIVRNLNKYPLSNGDNQYFVDNFNKHYISYSYDCEIVNNNYQNSPTQSFRITPKFSQWSAYYNLQAKVSALDINSNNYFDDIKYTTGFLNFGYSPNYNLLSYLNFLNPTDFPSTKEFYSMPNYIDVPGPQLNPGDILNQIYIDIGGVSIWAPETNKLNIGQNLKYIYDSFLKWTFVDVIITHFDSTTVRTDKVLIIDKYETPAIGATSSTWYVIEFHDKINFNNGIDIHYITILSRRNLKQISDDLQYINGLHRPQDLITNSYDFTSQTILGTFSSYETKLSFKVPSDSYTKILLSDYSVIKNLTGLIYTDYKYELAMQITKLDKEYELEVTSISNFTGNYQFDFNQPHLLNNNDYVIISMIGTQSVFPSTLLGYHNVKVLSPYSIEVPVDGISYLGDANFKIQFVKKDYFLNYQPIDIFDMGIGDKLIKQSVEIPNKNWEVSGADYNLINLDLNKYKFRLLDGLDLVSLNSKYSWILEAEISEAILGQDRFGNLIWYAGIWFCGRWFGGTWISGSWLSGDFYYGTWTSKSIQDNLLSIKVDNVSSNFYNSVWYDGRWFDGTWENGTWYNGRWYGGTHSDGRWFDGIWNDGLWNNGFFYSGVWVLGEWRDGIFNQENGPSFWLNGKFYGGDFENGTWYNGIFDQKNDKISRFGTKSYNSRLSIWRSGKFLGGQFHSFLNIDDNGNIDVSEVHKYSIWLTGLFGGGDFYGGLVYNINFKNTIWHGGISNDIKVLSISATASHIILDGDFPFNINDEIYLVDDQFTESFSVYGTTEEPKKYQVLTAKYDNATKTTTVMTDINLSTISGAISGTPSFIRAVSNFENSSWKTGVWYNGVFKGGSFTGGVWYNGYFEGLWG